jgi:hypothetical protein
VTLEETYRLLTLLRQYRRSLGNVRSVRRRIVRLLDASPGESALRESVLDTLETLLAARERRDSE